MQMHVAYSSKGRTMVKYALILHLDESVNTLTIATYTHNG